MKAILINDDTSLTWDDVPPPVAASGQVIIDVHAVGVNRADLMQRAGNYMPPAGWPAWMGLEASGVIAASAPNSRWKAGDRVCALLGGGGYAEQVAVPDNMVLPIPEGLSMEQAAAIPEVFTTSYLNLYHEGGMKVGDSVFIQGGASGLGTSAIQMAKAEGATVITTVGSTEKEALVQSLGADIVINRKTHSIAEQLAKHPVDIALDCVAGPQLGTCLKHLKPGGRWIVIATLGGAMAEIDMLHFFKSGFKLIGSTLRSRSNDTKGTILSGLQQRLWSKFSDGSMKTIIHEILPITEAEKAHDILEQNENLGKVILTIKRV